MAGKTISLRAKAVIMVSAFLLIMNIVLGAALMTQSRSAMKTLIDERMLDSVNTAADMIDGDALKGITEADKGTEDYDKIFNTLFCFKDNIGLEFIYVARELDDGSFMMVIDPAPENASDYGEIIAYTEALHEAGQGVASVDEEPYTDAYGRFYSAYSPVFDSSGEVAGVVAADFVAEWYESQLNRNAQTIVIACILFLGIGIAITLVLTRQFSRRLEEINENLSGFADDLDTLTSELSVDEPKGPAYGGGDGQGEGAQGEDAGAQGERAGSDDAAVDDASSDGKDAASASAIGGEDIAALESRIMSLRDNLRDYVSHAQTQANSMITAMASDYRSVYYVNLDQDDLICYRADPTDPKQPAEGAHISFSRYFRAYAEEVVAEDYREGFLRFIEPTAIREGLATKPIIGYRYLASQNGREYYEMIRMAGVRRMEDRTDHTVHAIGLGLTIIDEEMRETLAKNEALVEALAMAEEANTAKTAFLSSMSHEIRTPMNAIIGLNTLALRDETLSDQTREYLEKTGSSARHLLELINNILDMSRIESGRMVLRKEEFSFSTMLEQINIMVMSQCSDKGLVYECRILSKVDDYYIGDDTKLKEVLINILSNAVKFTEAPGSITFTVERTAVFAGQSTLKFVISDTGIGMDAAFIPKIFESFSQEDGSRKNKYGSTGLGMAITKNIVDMMNGTIDVESQKGVGTTFTVAVTLRNSDREGRAREGAIDVNSLRVLVVDDEEIAAEHARMVLDEAGIRADTCTGGEAALRMMEMQDLKQEPYNLVLMDWKMPEMDGLETSRRIREHHGNGATVIILTAYNWDEILDEAPRAGVDGFLPKPVFANSVIEEFEHIARRNDMSVFKEKKRADLTGRRILLAEDMEINAEIMMDVLSMRDIEADHAENGKEAVDMFAASAPGTYAAILMDIRMPVMDGLEATTAIRALDRPDVAAIPIIALTANAFDEDVQQSLQVGMNAHLTKPVESDHLFQTLEELVYEAENAR